MQKIEQQKRGQLQQLKTKIIAQHATQQSEGDTIISTEVIVRTSEESSKCVEKLGTVWHAMLDHTLLTCGKEIACEQYSSQRPE